MSARDLTTTLYDKDVDKGEGDIFLDMKELVLNDQDAPNKASERKVCIEVFDSDFACFLDFLMLINATGWGFQWFCHFLRSLVFPSQHGMILHISNNPFSFLSFFPSPKIG